MVTWFKWSRREQRCDNTPNDSNGDDHTTRRQRALRALIRWLVNGAALCLVHSNLFHTSLGIGVCLGILMGFFSALLQYQTVRLKAFYERDRFAAWCEKRQPQSRKWLLDCLSWTERFLRWLFV